MKQGTAELLLLTVIVSRSISYVLSKIGLNGMPPLELLSIRFFLTTVILLILFHKRLPQKPGPLQISRAFGDAPLWLYGL